MAVTLQHLRTSTATKIPTSLAAGQIAINLASGWLCVGTGGGDILVKGVAVSAYNTTATIFGVTGVTVPAKPAGPTAPGAADGKGYEIYQLGGAGVTSAGTAPSSPAVGQVYVNTSVAGKPAMLVWNGSAWVPPINPPKVYSLSGAEFAAGTGTGAAAKIGTALATKVGAGLSLNSGDTVIVGGTSADAGTYIYDGTTWARSGGSLPDATTLTTGGGTKGVVYLARDTDVQPAGVGTATPPDALAVATGAQVKALATLVAGMATGSTLLGRYDASVGGGQIVAGLTAAATAGTPARAGFIAGGKINAGSNAKEGDYFLVIKGGTVTGDAPNLNVALNANDHLVYDGAAWHVVASGVVAATPFSINNAADFDTDTVANIATADQKGLMMRDNSVAAGLDKAWKLVDVIDAGTF